MKFGVFLNHTLQFLSLKISSLINAVNLITQTWFTHESDSIFTPLKNSAFRY